MIGGTGIFFPLVLISLFQRIYTLDPLQEENVVQLRCPTYQSISTEERYFSFLGKCNKYYSCTYKESTTANATLNTCDPSLIYDPVKRACRSGSLYCYRNYCHRISSVIYVEPHVLDEHMYIVCRNNTVVNTVGCDTFYDPSTMGCFEE